MSSYRHMNEIIKNNYGHILWLGDMASAEDLQKLKQYSIKTVISAVQKSFVTYPSQQMIRQFKYPISDTKSQQINQYFDQVSDIIEKSLKFGSVLVHCAAGVSRSTTLVIAYLISKYKMTFKQSLKLCKQKRPEVCPNLGFELQLKAYDIRNNKKVELDKNVATYNIQFPGFGKKNSSLVKNSLQVKNSKIIGKGMSQSSNLQLTQKGSFSINRSKIKSDVASPEYLKQMARFRFGITNFEKMTKY